MNVDEIIGGIRVHTIHYMELDGTSTPYVRKAYADRLEKMVRMLHEQRNYHTGQRQDLSDSAMIACNQQDDEELRKLARGEA